MEKKKRQSNIELLRILAMGGVILLHYNNVNMGGALNSSAGRMNYTILVGLESLFIAAVNLFVMITGYFLFRTNKRSIGRAIALIFQTCLFSFVCTALKMAHGDIPKSSNTLLCASLPLNWFVILYAALYLVSPLLNRAIRGIDNKTLKQVILLLVILFSVWPSAVDLLSLLIDNPMRGLSTIGLYGSQRGYTIVQFVLCYMIGASLNQLTPTDMPKNGLRIGRFPVGKAALTLCLLALLVIIFVIARYYDLDIAWAYCSPLIVLEALTILLLFLQIDLGENRVINEISTAAFSVYLLHPALLQYLRIAEYTQKTIPVMLLHLAVITTGIITISYIVDKIYRILFSPLLRASKNWGRYEW